MPKGPVNLKVMYGRKYVVTINQEFAEEALDRDPWLAQIETRVGLIYPYSDTHLGVQVDHHPVVARRVAELGYSLIQDGGTEKTFLVPAGDLEGIAPLIRPYRRRRFKDAGARMARLAAGRRETEPPA